MKCFLQILAVSWFPAPRQLTFQAFIAYVDVKSGHAVARCSQNVQRPRPLRLLAPKLRHAGRCYRRDQLVQPTGCGSEAPTITCPQKRSQATVLFCCLPIHYQKMRTLVSAGVAHLGNNYMKHMHQARAWPNKNVQCLVSPKDGTIPAQSIHMLMKTCFTT